MCKVQQGLGSVTSLSRVRPFPRVWHTSVHDTENPQFPRISHISSITNSRHCLTADWERDPTVVATQSYHPALLTLGYRAFLQPQESTTTSWVVPIFQYHPPSPDNTVAGNWGDTLFDSSMTSWLYISLTFCKQFYKISLVLGLFFFFLNHSECQDINRDPQTIPRSSETLQLVSNFTF